MALYCAQCGTSLGEAARFCSSCGQAVCHSSAAPPWNRPRLIRPRHDRKLAGVCQGLANAYGWDVTLVRVIAILLAIGLFPLGILAYLSFWLLMPQEPCCIAPVGRPANSVNTIG